MSVSSLVQFKRSYLLVFASIIVGLIAVFINSKVSKENATKQSYIKMSLLIGAITTFIVYIHNVKGSIVEEVSVGPVPF